MLLSALCWSVCYNRLDMFRIKITKCRSTYRQMYTYSQTFESFLQVINIKCTVLQELLNEEVSENVLSTHLPRGSFHLSRQTVTLCSKGGTDCGTFDL